MIRILQELPNLVKKERSTHITIVQERVNVKMKYKQNTKKKVMGFAWRNQRNLLVELNLSFER